MTDRANRFLDFFHWPFFSVVAALVIFGLVNLYSAVHFWEGAESGVLFWNQLIWVGIGFVLMAVTSFFDYRLFKPLASWVYGIVLFLLIVSVVLGVAVRGTRGWLQFGFFNLQPAEFAKLAVVFLLARYYSDHPHPEGFSLLDLWRPMALTVVPFLLIIAQGDMGSALFLAFIFVSLALFARVKRRALVVLVLLFLVGAMGVYFLGLKDYQRNRILNFLHPEADVRGGGYHLVQSKIAVGSGMLMGKGYLKGNINKLRYLPERHTDFIFPVLAEEWGFFGALFVLGLYAVFLFMGIEIAKRARDRFGIFMGMGIVAMIFWQLVINLGGVLGLMPLTGVTLPLFSYGGSSMTTTLTAIGVMQNIHMRRFMF